MRARLFLLQKAWQINGGVFLSEHEAACVAATLIQSHGEQSANRGLMTAPCRPAWPLNLPEAPPPSRRNLPIKRINLDPEEMGNEKLLNAISVKYLCLS